MELFASSQAPSKIPRPTTLRSAEDDDDDEDDDCGWSCSVGEPVGVTSMSLSDMSVLE